MSNCINDMVWEQIWEQINLDEFTLDDREKILELLAEEIMEERAA